MAYSPVEIINQGLGKYSSSKVNSITPPSSSLERRCTGYPQWRESELAKRRWVFALDLARDLPQVASGVNDPLPYKYSLPPDILRPIRDKGAKWKQSGRFIFSEETDLTIPVILNVLEGQFDPLFVDVLACRVWVETVNFVQQSKTGLEDAQIAYDRAVAEAAKNNAFVIGSEDYVADDDDFPFITGRAG